MTLETGHVSTFAGNGVQALVDDKNPHQVSFNAPTGIAPILSRRRVAATAMAPATTTAIAEEEVADGGEGGCEVNNVNNPSHR